MSIYNHYTIYKMTNLVNNKVYIGQTIRNPKTRWSEHKRNSKKCNKKENNHLYSAMQLGWYIIRPNANS